MSYDYKTEVTISLITIGGFYAWVCMLWNTHLI